MTTSLMLKVDEPQLEAIYTWLQQRQPSARLFGWEGDTRAAMLAYGDGAADQFGWADWVTKLFDDPSTSVSAFDRLELITDEATASALNATFLGAFSVNEADRAHWVSFGPRCTAV